jgi:hypothetical protein
MAQSDAEGLIAIAGALTYVKSKEIAELALKLNVCRLVMHFTRPSGLVDW